MNFVPDGKSSQLLRVPYAGEARAADGWQGQDTGRSIETLKSDVVVAMGRLGGVVHGFQRGSYRVDDQDRAGVQISYSVEAPGGKMVCVKGSPKMYILLFLAVTYLVVAAITAVVFVFWQRHDPFAVPEGLTIGLCWPAAVPLLLFARFLVLIQDM